MGASRRVPTSAVCGHLGRLKAVTLTLMGYDSCSGQIRPNVASLDNLLDRIVTELDDLGPETTPEQLGGLRGSTFGVQLPPWLVGQLAAGSITYLHWSTLRQLDGLAKRLWVLLVAERYKSNGRGSEATWIKLGARAYTTLGMAYAHERQARAALAGPRFGERYGQASGCEKDGMSRDLLSSSAEDPRRFSTVELEEAPCDDRNGT
jgi:hypothetical protein